MAATRDAVDLLEEDHRRMAALLDQLDREERPEELHALFLLLAGDLAAHEAAEQSVVFPALRAASPSGDIEAHDRLDEHDEVNSLLTEMRGLDPAGFGFCKRTAALVNELRAHFASEEEGVFPRLRAALDHDELMALAEDVLAAKASAPDFPAIVS